MFSKKKIKVVIQLVDKKEKFFVPNVNTLTFEDLPIDVNVNVTTLPSGGSAKIKIYGVSKERMEMITTIKWKKPFITEKAIYVYADDGEGYKLLFEGNIMDAFPRYESAPDVYIDITAVMGAYHNMKEVPPFSRKGEVPTYKVFRDMCADYGVDCVNVENLVQTTCKDPYFDQSGLANRLRAASKAYNIYVVYENNLVKIYPQYLGEALRWDFTKENYIGYPQLTPSGIKISLDNINAVGLRDYFTIKGSEVSGADDTWKIIKYSYNLSTKIGGRWFMTIDGQRDML